MVVRIGWKWKVAEKESETHVAFSHRIGGVTFIHFPSLSLHKFSHFYTFCDIFISFEQFVLILTPFY